jgi:glutamate racemase
VRAPRAKTPTDQRIGVLDSGVGGLSVLAEIHRCLPLIPTLYYADQGHLPYGPRSADEIRQFVEPIAVFLIEQGAAVIVLACHAASATSLTYLRERYPNTPFVGIEPAVKPAAEATRSGVIGVLTTEATANGALYRRAVARYAANVRVITQVAPKLVMMVEQGTQNDPASEDILRVYLDPLITAHADQIVLACTHFPFLKDNLRKLTDMPLVDPSAPVARQVARVLPTSVQPAPKPNRYFTSGSPEQFQAMLKRLISVEAEVETFNQTP